MKIWLINPYGPIPGEGWRDTRYTMIGKTLAAQGHEVTWWTANFSHFTKRFRSTSWDVQAVSPNFEIRLVPAPGYRRHIGFDRIRFEIAFAWRVYTAVGSEKPPNVIIASYPPLSTLALAVRMSRATRAKLIIDIIDLRLELIVAGVPALLRPFIGFALLPLYAVRRSCLRRANAVTAVCNTYTESAPGSGRAIFWGIDLAELRKQFLPAAEVGEFARNLGKKAGEVWAVYAGTLGEHYDISTLLRCADLLEAAGSQVKIVIAGDGPRKSQVQEFCRRGPGNLRFLGRLPEAKLTHLYQAADMGIIAYSRKSTVAMPIKLYDYLASGLPVVNSLSGELEQLLRDHNAGVQYIAESPRSLREALQQLADNPSRRIEMSRNAALVAERFDHRIQYGQMASLVASTGEFPVADSSLAARGKRILDILAALAGLLFTLPLLGVAKLLMPSPVLFRQKRAGMHGRIFTIFKLRTMSELRDGSGQLPPDEARLTPLGRLIRRTSLDELPQFWNILRGDMSLVGPRPLLPEYLTRYNERQRRRHDVRPGLTGLAQVRGRNALTWSEKLELDVWYVEHRSLGLDLKIIAQTFWKVLTRDGISQSGHATMPEFIGSGEE